MKADDGSLKALVKYDMPFNFLRKWETVLIGRITVFYEDHLNSILL